MRKIITARQNLLVSIKLANVLLYPHTDLMIHPAKVFNTEETRVYRYRWKTCIQIFKKKLV